MYRALERGAECQEGHGDRSDQRKCIRVNVQQDGSAEVYPVNLYTSQSAEVHPGARACGLRTSYYAPMIILLGTPPKNHLLFSLHPIILKLFS